MITISILQHSTMDKVESIFKLVIVIAKSPNCSQIDILISIFPHLMLTRYDEFRELVNWVRYFEII
jgi:hypothetical protein